LALEKKLVELHGGQIKAKSEGEGQGSEFSVRLPRVDYSPTSAEQTADDRRTSRILQILVVDDNESLAKTLGWTLESLGHEARLAHDADSALASVQHFSPDVIMLDLGLPKVNGYDLCQMLRLKPALKESIFVAQTGWGQREHRDRAKAAGFDYYLVKPVDIEALKEVLLSIHTHQAQSIPQKVVC
jgi:CheY-like chemotaxis protein